MEIKVLGPLEIRQGDRLLELTAAKQRKALSLLAICAGDLVTVPALIEELWGADAPRSAAQTVQTYIMKLRYHIDENRPAGSPRTAKDMLVTRPCGYALDIARSDVDVHSYQEAANAGEHALAAGDFQAASDLLSTALDRWRGPALVDVDLGPRLGFEVTRLEQGRLTVLESRIDADLGLGRHRQLLGELAALTSRYPLHERLCEQYMTALHRSGRSWRALETFRTLRKTLVGELGIEPSRQLQHLQRRILRSELPPSAQATTCAKCAAA
jgi:DNA-binding SARP family transcriptional activator